MRLFSFWVFVFTGRKEKLLGELWLRKDRAQRRLVEIDTLRRIWYLDLKDNLWFTEHERKHLLIRNFFSFSSKMRVQFERRELEAPQPVAKPETQTQVLLKDQLLNITAASMCGLRDGPQEKEFIVVAVVRSTQFLSFSFRHEANLPLLISLSSIRLVVEDYKGAATQCISISKGIETLVIAHIGNAMHLVVTRSS
ncbi:hypothetical protein VNO77_42105 [Canavalia gladiata]|uniref:Uncharacterized protein n=1 Tax=Canavalia gladiata TaxID=3824 RepID=A0AAN9K2P3_CANGL